MGNKQPKPTRTRRKSQERKSLTRQSGMPKETTEDRPSGIDDGIVPPPAPHALHKQESGDAAAKIQAVWKGHKERSARDLLSNWKIFNSLENKEEADVYQLSSFLQAINEYMPAKPGTTSPMALVLESQLSTQSVGKIDITDLYAGVHLENPITPQNVLDMTESFKRGHLIHENYAIQILKSAIDYFQGLPNTKEVNIAPAEHITVVGDLHGQLDDLLLVFRENGVPSEENPYVFNGDFVDRGERSVEIALLILAYQLIYPNAVHVNRGNHEDRAITMVFGFMKECQEKYNTFVYELFIECFRWLPLACVIDGRILVLHGGLSRTDFSVKEFALLPRWEYELARSKVKPKNSAEKLREEQMNILRDILWSDPNSHKGIKNNKRGAGILFGPDVTEKFLLKNGLQLIIRSHECVPKGFHWPFGSKGMLVTLFSASNYCGKANNLGAFMRIPANKEKNPAFYQYMANSSERDLLVNNLDALFSLILGHRDELLEQFTKRDSTNSGCLSFINWAGAMEDVLQLNLQWHSVQPLLCSLNEKGQIDYNEFLDRYNVRDGSEKLTSEDKIAGDEAKVPGESDEEHAKRLRRRQVFNALYKHRAKLEALFRAFDKNGDGSISREEFTEGIELLNQHLPPHMEQFTNTNELMDLLDFGHDNSININEFMEAFRMNVRLTAMAKWKRAKTKIKVLAAFGKLVKLGSATRSSFS